MALQGTVYVIQSETVTSRHYVGLTSNLADRLVAHNHGESTHTKKYRPWKVVVRIDFASAERAAAFERYLKSGSGAAFLKRHLL